MCYTPVQPGLITSGRQRAVEGKLMAALASFAIRMVSGVAKVHVSSWVVDLGLGVALFLGALAIRLPHLMLVPLFTDETVEVLHSLKIMQGTFPLLTNADPYYGSLFNYLIAGVFSVFGPGAEHARLMVTTLGAATVSLTYFFAKAMEDRLVGLVTALLMLTSGALIVNGHVAWENDTTPFFATATLLLFALALKRGSGKLLMPAGFLYGLTLQTHPGQIVLAAGLVLYFLYAGLFSKASGSGRNLLSWLKSPWLYLTLAAALLGYANVIAQNFLQPDSSWTAAQRHVYALVSHPTLESYLTDVPNFGLMALRMASSTFDNRAETVDYLLMPANLLYLVLLLAGIGYAIKRGKLLPVIVLFTTALILPYFNKLYGYPGAARYVGYLFPLLYLLLAAPLVDAVRAVPSPRLPGFRPGDMPGLVLWLILILVVVSPALSVAAYYRSADRAGLTNNRVLAVHRAAQQEFTSGTVSEVLIDSRMAQFPLGGGGNVQRVLDYLYTLEKTPHRSLTLSADVVKNELSKDPTRPKVLVLPSEAAKTFAGKVQLVPLGPQPGEAAGTKYGAYLAQPSCP